MFWERPVDGSHAFFFKKIKQTWCFLERENEKPAVTGVSVRLGEGICTFIMLRLGVKGFEQGFFYLKIRCLSQFRVFVLFLLTTDLL